MKLSLQAVNPETKQKWILKKDEAITPENCIIKIMTNRKLTLIKSKDSAVSS